MESDTWKQVEQLFHQAMEQPIAEQHDFVLQHAKQNSQVASEVLSLLESHHSSNQAFLDPMQTGKIANAIDSGVNQILQNSQKAHTGAAKCIPDPENHSTWRNQATDKGTANSQSRATGLPSSDFEKETNQDAWHDLVVQRLAPQFEVEDVLSSGGMGTVFRANDQKLNRPVAIKVISASRCDPAAVRRFIRESNLAAQVSSDHVVTVYSVDDDSTMPTIVMELVEGPTLRRLIKQRATLSPNLAAEIARQTALGLADAHRQQLIHRDIKPANLMLQDFGLSPETDEQPVKVKIIDFGIARDLLSEEVTRQNALAGTPSYMSPEQIFAPESIDHRCDVYAVGATLYQMLTGEPPYRGAPHMIIRKMETRSLVPPRRWDDRIPVALESICLKALSHEPERRYQSANALARDLQRFIDRKPTLAKPVSSLTRLRLWHRRNQSLSLALSLLFLSLLAGTIVSSVMWNRSSQNAALATERANTIEKTTDRLADSNTQMRKAIDNFFMNLLADESEQAGLSSEFQFQLLTQMTEYYSSILEHSNYAPELVVEVCDSVVNFVDSRLDNGGAHAGRMLKVTHWVDEQLERLKTNSLSATSLNVWAHNKMLKAEASMMTPGYQAPPTLVDEAIELAEQALTMKTTKRGRRVRLLSKGIATNLRVQTNELSKEMAAQELTALASKMDSLANEYRTDPQLQIDRARFQRWIGKAGNAEAEIACRNMAASILKEALQTMVNNPATEPESLTNSKLESKLLRKLSVNHVWLGYANARNGNFDRAFQLYEKGIIQLEKLLTKHPAKNQFRMDLAETESLVADLKWTQGLHQESLDAYKEAMKWFEATLDSDPSQLVALRRCCQTHHTLAMRKSEIGNSETDSIDEHWQKSIAGYRSLFARGNIYVSFHDYIYFDQLLKAAIDSYSEAGNNEQANRLRLEQEEIQAEIASRKQAMRPAPKNDLSP